MKIIEKLKNNKIVNNLSYTVMASILNQLRGFLLVWTAIKFLSVEDYGKLVLVTFFITTIIELSDFGVNLSTTRFVAQYYQSREYKKFFTTIIYSIKRKLIAFCLVATGLVFFSEEVAAIIFNDVTLEKYVYLSIIAIFFGMNASVFGAVIQGKQSFSRILHISIGAFSCFGGFFLVLLFLGGLTFDGFILLNILVVISSCLFGFFYLRRDICIASKYIAYTKAISSEFNKFGNWMLIWSIFVIIKSKIDVFMLAHLATTEQVALYDVASKFTKPMMLVFSSYGQVITPLFAGVKVLGELRRLVAQTRKMCIIMTVGLVIGIVMAPYLIEIVIGGEYYKSVSSLQLIMFSLVFFVWTMPYNTTLFALNKPFVFSIDTVIGLMVTLIGNVLLIPLMGAEGASLTVVFVNLASLITSVYFYRRYTRSV